MLFSINNIHIFKYISLTFWTGLYCNWTWDTLLCWPPTPAGVLARMNCPGGFHGVDTRSE